MAAAVSAHPSPHSPAEQPAKRAKHSHNAQPRGVEAFSADRLTIKPVQDASRRLQKRFDDSRAVVTNGVKAGPPSHISISSDETASDADDSGDSDEEVDEGKKDTRPNGTTTSKAPLKSPLNAKPDALNRADHVQDDSVDFAAVLARAPIATPIDVNAAFESDEDVQDPSRQLIRPDAPTAGTLTTVLTQALRTNDSALIESCFRMDHVKSFDAVRTTIDRLDSHLASSLLMRLAERLHRRPGRASMLMVWMQWTFVAHGGYLASQPDVIKMLKKLEFVLRERAAGLTPLLSLKGRMDMLNGQLLLRREVTERIRTKRGNGPEDEAVIYVEGEESDSSGDEDEEGVEESDQVDDDEGDEDIPMVNGVDESDEEEDGDADSDADQLIDDEAEETDDDEDDEESEDAFEDDEDNAEDASEDEPVAKPVKRSTATGKTGFSRR